MTEELMSYYKLIRYSVHLQDVRLKSLKVNRLDGESKTMNVSIQRGVSMLEAGAVIAIKVNIDFEEDGPFELELELEGLCVATNESITEEELRQYAFDQVVPLLLPYARETVASTLARMHLPIFNIPTMDVLQSMAYNSVDSQE